MIARGYEWLLVKRYLSSKKRDRVISLTASLSIVAISLGVAALIVVMSVINGFRAELLDKILGYHGHVLVQGYGGEISDFDALSNKLRTADNVIKVTPFTEQQVMVTRSNRSSGAIVRGLPDELFTKENAPVADILTGDIEDAVRLDGVIIGYQLARRLGVTAGGDITIVSPKPVDTPFGSTLRFLKFPVVAVVEIGVYQFDETFIGMPIGVAQRFFRLEEKVSNIEVFLEDPELVDKILPQIQDVVGDQAFVNSWKNFNQALVGALQTERVAMFIVLTLIVLVAVFNIASSLFMLVKDKAADIAILRTMGMEGAAVGRVFVTVGMFVGLLGVLLGCLLAWMFVSNLDSIKSAIESMLGLNLWDPSVRFITEMKAVVNPVEVGVTIFVTLVLSFIATILPARRASKVDPVEVLRYE